MVLVVGEKSIVTITHDPEIVKRYYFSGQMERMDLHLPPLISSKSGDTGENINNNGDESSKSIDHFELLEKRLLVFGSLSHSEKYLAVCDNLKNLIIYCTKEWTVLTTFTIERKIDHAIFNEAEDKLIVSNRSGWIYSYDLGTSGSADNESRETFLLGHNAIILDLKLSPDSRYLASCDRDEKIRISNYPNCYNIESYCLGHTQFVSALGFVNEQILISGSGDGTLRVWQFISGKELSVHHFADDINKKDEKMAPLSIHTTLADDQILVVVTFYSSPIFVTYKFDTESNKLVKLISTDIGYEILTSHLYGGQLLCFVADRDIFVNCRDIRIMDGQLDICEINFLVLEALAIDDKLVESYLRDREIINNIGWLYKNSHDNHNEYFERKKERQETKSVKKIKSS